MAPIPPRQKITAVTAKAVANFKGDVAVLMAWLRCSCSSSERITFPHPKSDLTSLILHLRTIRRAAGLQRVGEQFDPVLAPEYLAVEHVTRRTEHIRRQRILAILLVDGTDLIGSRTLDQPLAGQRRIVGHFSQRRRLV